MMRKNDKNNVRVDAVIFSAILLCFFLVLAVVSLGYNPRARSIPLVLGILGSLMIGLQLLVDAFPRLRAKLRFIAKGGILDASSPLLPAGKDKQEPAGAAKTDPEAPPAAETPSGNEWWAVFRVILWLALFILLLGTTNYLIAVGAFIFLVTKIEAKESWVLSISLALGLDASFYILFDLLLKANL